MFHNGILLPCQTFSGDERLKGTHSWESTVEVKQYFYPKTAHVKECPGLCLFCTVIVFKLWKKNRQCFLECGLVTKAISVLYITPSIRFQNSFCTAALIEIFYVEEWQKNQPKHVPKSQKFHCKPFFSTTTTLQPW